MPQIHFGYGVGWVYLHVWRALSKFMLKHTEGRGRFYRVNVPPIGWCYWFVLPDEGKGIDPELLKAIEAYFVKKKLQLPNPFHLNIYATTPPTPPEDT